MVVPPSSNGNERRRATCSMLSERLRTGRDDFVQYCSNAQEQADLGSFGRDRTDFVGYHPNTNKQDEHFRVITILKDLRTINLIVLDYVRTLTNSNCEYACLIPVDVFVARLLYFPLERKKYLLLIKISKLKN